MDNEKLSQRYREKQRQENTEYEVFKGSTPWGVVDGYLIVKRDPELSYVKSWALTDEQARDLRDQLSSRLASLDEVSDDGA